MPKVFIAIPTYNSKEYLKECIISIQQNVSIDYKIAIADDGSTDGTKEMIEREFPEILLIFHEHNEGINQSRRDLVQAFFNMQEYDFFMRLDADTEVFKNSIETLVEFLEKSEKVGAVGPQIVNAQGITDYTSYGLDRIGAWKTFKDYSFIVWKCVDFLKNKLMKPTLLDHPIQVDHTLGAAVLAKRQAVIDAGLPDTHIAYYREDTDWPYEMKEKDWEIWYNPQALVKHIGGSTTVQTQMYQQGKDAYLKSGWNFIHKWYPGKWNEIKFTSAVIGGSLLSLMFGILLIPFAVVSSKVRIVTKRIFRTFTNVIVWHVRISGKQ